MKKKDAILRLQAYFNRKDFSWEIIHHVDEEPIENEEFWIFRNLWEPRESIRGNQIYINPAYPMIIVRKYNGCVEELSTGDIDRLKIF